MLIKYRTEATLSRNQTWYTLQSTI